MAFFRFLSNSILMLFYFFFKGDFHLEGACRAVPVTFGSFCTQCTRASNFELVLADVIVATIDIGEEVLDDTTNNYIEASFFSSYQPSVGWAEAAIYTYTSQLDNKLTLGKLQTNTHLWAMWQLIYEAKKKK